MMSYSKTTISTAFNLVLARKSRIPSSGAARARRWTAVLAAAHGVFLGERLPAREIQYYGGNRPAVPTRSQSDQKRSRAAEACRTLPPSGSGLGSQARALSARLCQGEHAAVVLALHPRIL